MTQLRIRMRKLALKTGEKIMTTPRKEKKRELRREEKAQTAALLEKNIEKELIERVTKGMDPGIINIHAEALNKILDDLEGREKDVNEDEIELETEYVEADYEDEDAMEDFDGFPTEEGSDDDDNAVDDEDDDDDEAAEVVVDRKRGRPDSKYALKKQEKDAKRKKGGVLVEVEHEDTDRRQKAIV